MATFCFLTEAPAGRNKLRFESRSIGVDNGQMRVSLPNGGIGGRLGRLTEAFAVSAVAGQVLT